MTGQRLNQDGAIGSPEVGAGTVSFLVPDLTATRLCQVMVQ